ncbi:MAG: hypothetical protein J0I15_07190 [Herbaspirillum huttiense]|uniref:hypothetical protein n=1 Tax=Herbaspirillum huttiense TaxID=863372 RepID=UPI001AD4EED6|nr:hypothetical protein [Herbaspirillum huttiense]MBN9356214.1 hypothetical protein [Herbaspirillum huttiense]
MIAAIPAEDRPTIIEQVVHLPGDVHRVRVNTIISPAQRTCLSCGAKTNAEGQLPCGH